LPCSAADTRVESDDEHELETVSVECRDLVGCMLHTCGPINEACGRRCNLDPDPEEDVDGEAWLNLSTCIEQECAGNGAGRPLGIMTCVRERCAGQASACGYPVNALPVNDGHAAGGMDPPN